MRFLGKQDVLKYERHRYTGLDQWFINMREQMLVRRLLNDMGYAHMKMNREKRFSKNLAGPPPTRILDIPCGYGRFSISLGRFFSSVVSADISSNMVSRCREKAKSNGGYVVMDLRNLPFKDATFEATFTVRLFQHKVAKEQMGEILKELARVSRRWVTLSYYKNTALHTFWRKARRRSSRISQLSPKKFIQYTQAASLKVRFQYTVIPLLHAQVLVALEKAVKFKESTV